MLWSNTHIRLRSFGKILRKEVNYVILYNAVQMILQDKKNIRSQISKIIRNPKVIPSHIYYLDDMYDIKALRLLSCYHNC
jgi:uncharacterized protein YlbG (UPF0298 family)